MEPISKPEQPAPLPKKKKQALTHVAIVRDWKEYLGESLLIIFSVLLALFLTEVINKIHENNETKALLKDVREELIHNEDVEKRVYSYQQSVLSKIDSALKDTHMQQEIVSNGVFNLNRIAPEGIGYPDLSDIAWQIAKQHNITSKISLEDVSLLTYIYQEQEHIIRSEQEVAKVFFDRQSRDPLKARETLILMRDNYRGWSVDRAGSLLKLYEKAINKLK